MKASVQMAGREQIAESAPGRLIIIAAVMIDEHKIQLDAQHTVECVHPHGAAHTVQPRQIPNLHQQYGQIAGYARGPQLAAVRRRAGLPMFMPRLAQGGIKNQRTAALQQMKACSVHSAMAQHGTQLGAGKLQCAPGREILGYALHAHALLPRLDQRQRKMNLPLPSRFQPHPRAQRGAGIEHIAKASGEAAADSPGQADGACAPRQFLQVGFIFRHFHAGEQVNQLRQGIARLAPLAAEAQGVFPHAHTLHKQILKRRMGVHIPPRCVSHGHAAGDFDFALLLHGIGDFNQLVQGSVLG